MLNICHIMNVRKSICLFSFWTPFALLSATQMVWQIYEYFWCISVHVSNMVSCLVSGTRLCKAVVLDFSDVVLAHSLKWISRTAAYRIERYLVMSALVCRPRKQDHLSWESSCHKPCASPPYKPYRFPQPSKQAVSLPLPKHCHLYIFLWNSLQSFYFPLCCLSLNHGCWFFYGRAQTEAIPHGQWSVKSYTARLLNLTYLTREAHCCALLLIMTSEPLRR